MGCFKSKNTEAVLPVPKISTRPRYAGDPKPLAEADSKTKVIAERSAANVGLEAGMTVYYCTCGRSTRQPFCDGSHKGTIFNPLPYMPEKSGQAYFCRCKGSLNPPLCDGSHNRLKW
jgi:CDGSH-type Zn-finger protein